MRLPVVSRALVLMALCAWTCLALTPADVLVWGNSNSAVSKSITEYYARRRAIAREQILMLATSEDEEIPRAVFDSQIARPLAAFLRRNNWHERILAIVTTSGVPLKIRGDSGMTGEAASVDSEIAALYQDLHGRPHQLPGPLANPYYRSAELFRHPNYPLYLVTRLTGYTFADVRGLIDRSLEARDRGVVVLDMKSHDLEDGNYWLSLAAHKIPIDRLLLEESDLVVRGARQVIAYASWGSNDSSRHERDLQFAFLPGAIVTEYVSTDGRTFREPPASWQLGTWSDRSSHYAGSPQSLAGDFIRQGATGVTGHVYEPFLDFTPRPDFLIPAYLRGSTLAESFYSSIPAVSWMNIMVGDPLCRLLPSGL